MASEYLEKSRRSLRLACADVVKCDPVAAQCTDAACPLSNICPRWIPAPPQSLPARHRSE